MNSINLAVELVNVSKLYPGTPSRKTLAVDSLNLEIKTGEFFSLLGPSGCGKTTTLRMIAGFEIPSSGEIYIHKQAMNHHPPFHRPVNTVFQNYALFPHLTVSQNIAFGLEMENIPRPDIRQRVSEVLELVQLVDLQNRYPRQLSGGQQQRVALARALVKQPKVLLFDEPLGALDLKLRKEMQLELKQMQKRLGITFIYVTHDQEEALTMSDRIGVMNQGQLLQVGTPVEIYEYPKTRFVADFIGESNIFTGRVTQSQKRKINLLVDEQLSVSMVSQTEVFSGQLLTIVIRPEKASLVFRENKSHNHWQGIIEEAIYLGTDTRYRVKLTPNTSMIIRQQNLQRDQTQQYAIGETVNIFVSPENISFLPE
ncbi:polyamine ABC transporter, ATP-binding family protein [Lyngbya aestuarii BL J]|uniref:Spermidine/putrescine import ATP-binding protein PotA n=1 Tax=Lyngbya aestuarii BL J TaxID=1348334 RepID=U7QAL9_9CYAN|nr:ABC transporter ATP-binding protein [Lyngbya aestuarii]ERT04242.1 polyamine ABC transporter, ATP-binding family protein [Lyngbya aestuarii BL J]